MKRINPAYLEAVAKKVSASPFFTLISMEITNLDWSESLVEVVVQEQHFQPFGLVHGGVYSSLVDAAAFWAVYTQIDEHMGLTTVELNLNYLAPITKGTMIAKGRSIKVGKTLCVGEASIENERGKLLARGTETMMTRTDVQIQGSEELPPKYLD